MFPLVLVSATLAESAAGLVADAREALDRGIGAPPQWLGELPLVGPRLQDYWETVAAVFNFAATLALCQPRRWLFSVLVLAAYFELVLGLVIAFLHREGGTAAPPHAFSSRIGERPRVPGCRGRTIKGVG